MNGSSACFTDLYKGSAAKTASDTNMGPFNTIRSIYPQHKYLDGESDTMKSDHHDLGMKTRTTDLV